MTARKPKEEAPKVNEEPKEDRGPGPDDAVTVHTKGLR